MVFTLFATLSLSRAAPICPPNHSVIAGPSEVAKLLIRVNTYGKADRQKAKDFAKSNNAANGQEIEKRYAASADMQCGDYATQVQLVLKNNTVLAPLHGLPGDICHPPKNYDSCKITFKINGKAKEFKTKEQVATGYKCDPNDINTKDLDWSILRLSESVDASVKPYAIAKAPCASDSSPVDVVSVAKSIDWDNASGKSWSQRARHYGNCQLRKGNCGQDYPAMSSDCDTSGGSSGRGNVCRGRESAANWN